MILLSKKFIPSTLFFLVFIVCFIPTTKSQDEPIDTQKIVHRLINDTLDINKTVAVIPFSTSFDYDPSQADYSRMLTEVVQSAIVQSNRFIMVERMDIKKTLDIKREQDDNEQEYEFWKKVSDSHLVKAGRQLGVEYIFTGNITNVATSIVISGGYRCEFGFTIKAISVETGKIYVTESINEGTDKLIGKNSKKEALIAALEKVVEPVKVFIDKYFPIEVPFYEIKERNRKGAPKSIIIKGGLSNGLRFGQELDIALKGKGDNTYREKIGEAEIIEITADFATCKVKRGAEEIGKKIESNKALVIAMSKAYESKGVFGIK